MGIESGSSSRKQRREAAASFSAWRANLAGVDDCSTAKDSDPVYPNSGPDVEYGDDVTEDSPPSPDDCDAPIPPVQAYRAAGDAEPPVSYVYAPTITMQDTLEPTPVDEEYEQLFTYHTEDSENEKQYLGPNLNAQAQVDQSTSEPSYGSFTMPSHSTSTCTLTVRTP